MTPDGPHGGFGGLCGEVVPRRFGQDGTLQDLSSRHTVTGIRATAFLQEY